MLIPEDFLTNMPFVWLGRKEAGYEVLSLWI